MINNIIYDGYVERARYEIGVNFRGIAEKHLKLEIFKGFLRL